MPRVGVVGKGQWGSQWPSWHVLAGHARHPGHTTAPGAGPASPESRGTHHAPASVFKPGGVDLLPVTLAQAQEGQ